MKRFTNPLDNIRVASPCSADWNQMYGNERRRFCADCKLNVYNLSDMTRDEAESFLMASEGRVCVRYFRRADGTVLTKNCPVGLRAAVRRASKAATAAFSLVVSVFLGLLGIRAADALISVLPVGDIPPVEETVDQTGVNMGEAGFPVAGEVDLEEFRPHREGHYVEGRVENIEDFRNRKVVAWVE